MVSLKTKANKHTLDDEKRRRSIKEKEKAKLNQSQIVKQALSNATLNSSSNKKIVFDDDDDDGASRVENIDNKQSNGQKNCILFSDSDCEEETPTIEEKVQFSGKKGFELLSLQSTYGNDERFKIDERFLDDEKEDNQPDDDSNTVQNETDPTTEKKKMLNILKGVLGDSDVMQDSTKIKKRQFDMIRYDASKKEHEIYEIKSEPEVRTSIKKKKLKRLHEGNAEEQPKPLVSKEKFYKVSGEIKNSFKENEEEGPFSLLQTYGAGDVEDVDIHEGIGAKFEEKMKEKEKKESKEKVASKEEKRVAVAQGIWKESFFFEKNDPRFKDCLEFINKKNSTEAAEAAENYDQTRRRLREILRLHMKKQLRKKETFRNKIGGGNKKQLAKSGPKTKALARKGKPPKV